MQIVDWCRRHWFGLGLTALFILPWVAFGQALFQDFAPIDDGFLIVNNPIVHGINVEHIKLAFTTFDPELYIPLTTMSFQLDWLLGGGMPFVFHLTNIILQGVNAIFVAMFLVLLFGNTTRVKALALVAAGIFAIHPLHTEAVVWVAGRKDILCAFFFLASGLCYLQSTKAAKRKSIALFVAASMLLFVLALLSKVLAAMLPAVFVLDLLLRQRPHSVKKSTMILVPFFVLAIAFLYVATFGKAQVIGSSSLLETFTMAQKSAWFYLSRFFLPVGLTPIYPFQKSITLSSPEFFLPMLLHFALAGTALWQWKKRPTLSYGILFFYITLVPTFFNFHKGDLYFFAVDRYAYIPSIGILISLFSIALSVDWSHLKKTSIGIVTVLFLILASHSMSQTSTWDSPDTLFGRAIRLYPESVSTRMAMGSILRERNELEDAFTVLHDGAKYSTHPGLNVEAGLVYSAAGQVADARQQFQMALKKNPTLPPPLYYLGFLDEYEGNNSAAMLHYMQAVANDPSYVTARVHLAGLQIKQKKFDDARAQLLAAYGWNPVSGEVIDALIELEKQMGRVAEAQKYADYKTRIGIGNSDK